MDPTTLRMMLLDVDDAEHIEPLPPPPTENEVATVEADAELPIRADQVDLPSRFTVKTDLIGVPSVEDTARAVAALRFLRDRETAQRLRSSVVTIARRFSGLCSTCKKDLRPGDPAHPSYCSDCGAWTSWESG
jgi:hypothetical protein